MKVITLASLLLLIFLCKINGLENGLARTPPLGWMSWEKYRCTIDCDKHPNECIDENLFMRMADAMVNEGYKDAGYEYIIIDDCWLEMERGEDDRLVPDRKRFPHGMKYLADYIHAKGLKFGMYENFGTKTCAGYPGIINHMELDANTFAEWEVDYIKIDGCYVDIHDMDWGYPEFGRLLNATGRPMVYSCSWPVYQEVNGIMPDYEALKEHCNLWRNWYDITMTWDSIHSISQYFAENQDRIQPHGGSGHWNDPDMILVGNDALPVDLARMQMAVWSVLAAPLIMSNDLDAVSIEHKEILQNKQIIKVNQDPLGIQGLRIQNENGIETWARPIEPIAKGFNSYAIAFVNNLKSSENYYRVRVDDLGLYNKNGYMMMDLYDLTGHAVKVTPSTIIEMTINPRGCNFYKFTSLE